MNSRANSQTVLLIATLLFVLTALLEAMVAPLSVMAFDTGPSTFAWLFVGIMFSYPVFVIVTQVAAWLTYRGRAYRPAIAVAMLPLLYPLALVLLFAFGA